MFPDRINSIVDAVGNTPLLKLGKIAPGVKAEIHAKLEFLNPMGSVKDRTALHMIEKAERAGLLKAGMTVIDNSSGNTALGLAMVCAIKGYKLKIITRDTTSPEKVRYLQALEVDLVFADTSLPPDSPGATTTWLRSSPGKLPEASTSISTTTRTTTKLII